MVVQYKVGYIHREKSATSCGQVHLLLVCAFSRWILALLNCTCVVLETANMNFPMQRFEFLHQIKLGTLLPSDEMGLDSEIVSPVFKATKFRVGTHFQLVVTPQGCTYPKGQTPSRVVADRLGIFIKKERHLDRIESRRLNGPMLIRFFVDVHGDRMCLTEVNKLVVPLI